MTSPYSSEHNPNPTRFFHDGNLLPDRADGPYTPRHPQGVCLNLEVDDVAILPLPEFSPRNAEPIDGGNMNDSEDFYEIDSDDSLSDSLESLKDDQFPSYFIERGSPPRLFDSHGAYGLPVDGSEQKVCTTNFRWYNRRAFIDKNTPAYRGRKGNIFYFKWSLETIVVLPSTSYWVPTPRNAKSLICVPVLAFGMSSTCLTIGVRYVDIILA